MAIIPLYLIGPNPPIEPYVAYDLVIDYPPIEIEPVPGLPKIGGVVRSYEYAMWYHSLTDEAQKVEARAPKNIKKKSQFISEIKRGNPVTPSDHLSVKNSYYLAGNVDLWLSPDVGEKIEIPENWVDITSANIYHTINSTYLYNFEYTSNNNLYATISVLLRYTPGDLEYYIPFKGGPNTSLPAVTSRADVISAVQEALKHITIQKNISGNIKTYKAKRAFMYYSEYYDQINFARDDANYITKVPYVVIEFDSPEYILIIDIHNNGFLIFKKIAIKRLNFSNAFDFSRYLRDILHDIFADNADYVSTNTTNAWYNPLGSYPYISSGLPYPHAMLFLIASPLSQIQAGGFRGWRGWDIANSGSYPSNQYLQAINTFLTSLGATPMLNFGDFYDSYIFSLYFLINFLQSFYSVDFVLDVPTLYHLSFGFDNSGSAYPTSQLWAPNISVNSFYNVLYIYYDNMLNNIIYFSSGSLNSTTSVDNVLYYTDINISNFSFLFFPWPHVSNTTAKSYAIHILNHLLSTINSVILAVYIMSFFKDYACEYVPASYTVQFNNNTFSDALERLDNVDILIDNGFTSTPSDYSTFSLSIATQALNDIGEKVVALAAINTPMNAPATFSHGLTSNVARNTFVTANYFRWDGLGEPTMLPATTLYAILVTAQHQNLNEFAPVFNRGLISRIPLDKIYTTKEREMLLAQKINSLKLYEGAWVFNNNLTATFDNIIFKEENIKRLANAIARELKVQLKTFIGRQNVKQVREEVVNKIRYMLDRVINIHKYRPESYRIICDETNNRDYDNYLYVDIDVRMPMSVKYVRLVTVAQSLVG